MRSSRRMPRHIRDFFAPCGAKFESQLGKCTEKYKRKRPKLGRTARKFLLCGITIQFTIYYSYGFGSWEVNEENVTVITHVIHWEVLFFLASKVAISALSLYGFDSFRSKILRSNGWGNYYSYGFIFLTLKDCPAKFSRNSDQRKYYFFDLSCNQLPQLWPEMQIRPFKSPTGI